MRRNLTSLADREFDLAIVGGGIFGICAAWDAALRGLSVALVERGDFAHATSANSFKIVHGGIRYLQHGDLYRVRESSQERNALLRVAPHLVDPLPMVIPTYGHGLRGKELLRAALGVYDLVTFDRNRGLTDSAKHIPPGCAISREECLRLFPALDRPGLTGAAVFHDAQMYNPPRLSLSFLHSAVEAGAEVANYAEAIGFTRRGDRILGVEVRDVLTGDRFTLRATMVLNAAGPWAEHLLGTSLGLRLDPALVFSRDACFVVGRRLLGDHALAVQGRTSDPDAWLNRGSRHLFIVPWRVYTLIGVWHVVHTGPPDAFTLTAGELEEFLREINGAYPSLGLTLEDVSTWNAGLVLFGENKPGAADLSYGKRSIIVDHRSKHGLEGLVSMIGLRYTTARGVADRAIDLVFRKMGRKPPPSRTASTPVYGGRIENFESLVRDASREHSTQLRPEVLRRLLRNHGAEYRRVLRLIPEDAELARTVGDSTVISAEVIHAVREEAVVKLADVVFRRTDLGTGANPGDAALETCAELMARELGWSEGRRRQELDEVRRAFPHF